MNNALASYTNAELGMTSFVFANTTKTGGFNVTLRDDDSGEFVPLAICGIQSLDAAKAKAQEAAK